MEMKCNTMLYQKYDLEQHILCCGFEQLFLAVESCMGHGSVRGGWERRWCKMLTWVDISSASYFFCSQYIENNAENVPHLFQHI